MKLAVVLLVLAFALNQTKRPARPVAVRPRTVRSIPQEYLLHSALNQREYDLWMLRTSRTCSWGPHVCRA